MKSRDIGPIPIIENEQTMKLVGIVTGRDLALKIVADGRDPKTTKAEAVMTREVVTCRGEDDMQNALDAMYGMVYPAHLIGVWSSLSTKNISHTFCPTSIG